MPQSVSGVLITSDEATIQYIKHVSSAEGGPNFIIDQPDDRHLLIMSKYKQWVQDKLQQRMADLTYKDPSLGTGGGGAAGAGGAAGKK